MLSDYLLHGLKYLRLVCSARRIVMPLVMFLCLSGWLIAWYLPNVYQSETRVYVDPQTTLQYLLKGIVDENSNVEQDLVDVARVSLVTTANLEKVANENDMLLDVRTDIDKQIILEELAGDVSIMSQRRSGTREGTQDLVISYRDIDGDRSKAIVRSFLDVFLNTVLKSSRLDGERSVEFLEKQIGQYSSLLNDAEESLKRFKIENSDVMPGDSGGFFEELRNAEEKSNDASLELLQARQRRDRLSREYARTNSQSGTSSADALRRAGQIRDLETQLSELLLRFTDNHPDVIGTRDQLANLRRDFVPPTINKNNVGSQIALAELARQLSTAEADVGAAEAKLDEYKRRVVKLRAAVNTIPEVEDEFNKLTRDYDVLKDRYEDFVKRREQARILNDADGNVDFRIIEPPRTLPRPVEPNRPLLITLIFLGAWAMGVAIPILLDLVRPSVSSLSDIAKLTEWPVLGTVSMTEQSAATMRVGMKTLLVFLILTVIAYGALAVLSVLPQGFTLQGMGSS